MRSNNPSIGVTLVLAIFTVTLLVPGTEAAAQEAKVLHNFSNNGKDGFAPYAGVIFDAAGNLYGTTLQGGAYDQGTVFELSPAGGGWKETRLHTFNPNVKDGLGPYGGLIFDGAGNLYGTTGNGGSGRGGTVFQLSPVVGGGWREKILHNFNYNGGKDGIVPYASLIFDAVGNLYGTTLNGGPGSCTNRNGDVVGCGTVFELTPKADGAWTEKILHRFDNRGTDGYFPYASLVLDASGNLYGTTFYGGAHGYGTVFELTPQAGGSWTETMVYSFCSQSFCTDGSVPFASLIFDAAGNLYGTTQQGGGGGGTVFELTPSGGGAWTESILASFSDSGDEAAEGTFPAARLIFDAAGNLYGTTASGGANGWGTAFELSPGAAGGVWTEKVLHNFNYNPYNGTDGADPTCGLIFDAAGNLYGTTFSGGSGRYGTVFEIRP